MQIANAKSQLIRARNRVKNAKNLYKTTLNLPLYQDISVQGSFEVKEIDIQLDDLIDIARDKRPEVRKALLNEEIGMKQISIAKTKRLPDLAFFSNYQISHNERLTQMNRILEFRSTNQCSQFLMGLPPVQLSNRVSQF